jgi:acetyltransferase-like isoleucine patch superfamily enzyme
MSMRLRKLREATLIALQLTLWLFPWRLRRALLRAVFDFDISDDARIGFSIVMSDTLVLRSGSWIGHFNLCWRLEEMTLNENATIGNFNRIAGVAGRVMQSFYDQPDRRSCLTMERDSAITHSHIVDCTDSVHIGQFSIFGGWHSQILTHSIDIKSGRQQAGPVSVGAFCFLGTGCILLKGAVLPDKSVLSAGSVLSTVETEALTLYSGVPARRMKSLDPDSVYFRRAKGVVS